VADLKDARLALDGFANLEGGVNGALEPDLISPNQCAFAINCTLRGGYADKTVKLPNPFYFIP